MATIAVIGSIAQDDIVLLAEPLQPGAHLDGVPAGSRLGGGGANTAVALAAAGHTVVLLAAVGRDAAGEALLTKLTTAGVETAWISRLDSATTRSLILIDPAGERTVVNVARCEDEASPERLLDIPAKAIYVRSRRRDLGALLAAKAASSLVVAHLPPVEPGVRPVRILVASASDLDPDALRNPVELGRRVSGGWAHWMVITHGATGASAWSDEQGLQAPAAVVDPVDTTGAGDAFAAGLLHALVSGQTMEEALALAVRFGTEATLWTSSGLPASAVRRLCVKPILK